MRVESLREDYGFTCECERCTSELVNMDKVRPHAPSIGVTLFPASLHSDRMQVEGVYDDLYRQVTEELGPLFLKAKGMRNGPAVQGVRDDLRSLLASLYAAFRKSFLQPQVNQAYVQA